MEESGPLALELGEGFTGDEVVVVADGREVWRTAQATTNWSVGLADVVRLPPSTRSIEVRTGGVAEQADVPPRAVGERRLRADRGEDGTLRISAAPDGPLF